MISPSVQNQQISTYSNPIPFEFSSLTFWEALDVGFRV
jgi:hypothetical protein